MKRKEALDKIQQDKYNCTYGNRDYYASYSKNLINEIYDNFDNRICKNCKYFGYNACYNDNICDTNGDYIITEEDFGCNRFKREKNE